MKKLVVLFALVGLALATGCGDKKCSEYTKKEDCVKEKDKCEWKDKVDATSTTKEVPEHCADKPAAVK